MTDVGYRDLGAIVPGHRSEPTVAPPGPPAVARSVETAAVIELPPPASADAGRTVFAGDLPNGRDALGIEAPVAHLAELAAHANVVAPLCIGLLGGAGSGKTFALHSLLDRIGALARGAAAVRGPFLSRVHIQAVDATSLEGDPALALAAQLHAGLTGPHPDLAREIAHSARDPHVVARDTEEKLDHARRRLDAERQMLEETGARMARLPETVLFEAAGSQVDTYARANRGRLAHRLASFGLAGDPIKTYKDLVRACAEDGGSLGLSLRALYSFKGQARLLVLAVIFVLAGVGLGVALQTQDTWLAQLRTGPQFAATAGSWLDAHMDWLDTARKAAFALAGLAIVADLWRAFGFVQPISKGARLLEADLAGRRRDLDNACAHQTKRVDGLTTEVDRLTRASAEAERRLGSGTTQAGIGDAPPFEPQARALAQNLFTSLGRSIRTDNASSTVPQRVVVALDHLEAVAPDRARLILDTLHRLAATSGIVTIVALDPQGLGLSVADLQRWVQMPLRLDAGREDRDQTTMVKEALGHPSEPPGRAIPLDAARSALDEPIGEDEAGLLAALAPIAGSTPRAVKRFVNLYTLARLDGEAQKGALALMLALDQGGTLAERQVAEEAMAGDAQGEAFEPRQTSPRLRTALDAVRALDGRLSKADVAKAAARATLFSLTAFA